MDKVGVFLCTGCEIGDLLDIDGLTDSANEEGAAKCIKHECLCSPEGVEEIDKAISEDGINGVLIAACSPRVKVKEFSFDKTKIAVERVSLREQAVWSQKGNEEEDIHMIGDDLLRMGIAKITRVELPTLQEEEISEIVMVVGGGYAGLHAAQAAADLGKKVVVLEAEKNLGGYLANVTDLVPEEPPYNELHKNNIVELIAEVEKHENVKVYKEAEIASIHGQPGQFKVEVKTPSGSDNFIAGTIVQATGAIPYDAKKLPNLGYGELKDVITTTELEAMLKDNKLARPSNGDVPNQVVFVQCAGSRDENHLPYCSSECCTTTLKQAAVISREYPDVSTSVVYKDLRAPGQMEHFYLGVQESTGSMLTRGVVDKVSSNGNGKLAVEIKESLLGDEVSVEADLVVLAVGMVPNSADGELIREHTDAKGRAVNSESEKQRIEAAALVEKLKQHEGTEILNLDYRQGPDLPTLKYGFPDSHYICFPYETRRTGIYAAGAVHAPMDAAQAAEDGYGAAMKAVQCINSMLRGEAVHPRAGDQAVAEYALSRCTQCKRCTEECPFGTLNEDVKGTPEYFQLRCRKCGICLGSCPERIVSFPDYSVDGIASMIKAFEVPDEFDEKPRIIALMCENDAIPALDEAALNGKTWNTWTRIVPVRCLGACNVVWIADSLSRGIDGIILIGCQKGDDYQCHYMKGSELASYRMENVQETLNRLSLEPERVQIVELARDEFQRIPEVLDEFSEAIEDMGPNPYKGF